MRWVIAVFAIKCERQKTLYEAVRSGFFFTVEQSADGVSALVSVAGKKLVIPLQLRHFCIVRCEPAQRRGFFLQSAERRIKCFFDGVGLFRQQALLRKSMARVAAVAGQIAVTELPQRAMT